eukprot:364310-Chlamydomonas_euryale.AAC.14
MQDVADVFRAVAAIECAPPNSLPPAQSQPPQLRFPQFCDALVRLGLAANARAAAGVPGGRPPHAPAAHVDAVGAFAEAIGVTSANMSVFKRRLDDLARNAGTLGARRGAIKHLYVNAPSGFAAAQVLLPPLPPSGWTIVSAAFAPPVLHDALRSADSAIARRYLPRWTAFPAPALDLGAVQPTEVRCARVVLRNRGRRALLVHVDTSGADGSALSVSFNETTLPPGMPRVLDVLARFGRAGEYSGAIDIYTRAHNGPRHLNQVSTSCGRVRKVPGWRRSDRAERPGRACRLTPVPGERELQPSWARGCLSVESSFGEMSHEATSSSGRWWCVPGAGLLPIGRVPGATYARGSRPQIAQQPLPRAACSCCFFNPSHFSAHLSRLLSSP